MDNRENWVSHPSIPYLDNSPSQGRLGIFLSAFIGEHITVTEKMDGEITSLYKSGYFHSRSLTRTPHWSRTRFSAKALEYALILKDGESLVFENMQGTHTVEYNDLESYHYLLYFIRGRVVRSVKETTKTAEANGLTMPTVLFSGVLKSHRDLVGLAGYREGYVIRLSRSFPYDQLSRFSGKCVVGGFVQSDEHWFAGRKKENQLRGNNE